MQDVYKNTGRIIFFLPDVIGGVNSVVTNLSERIQKQGIRYHIFKYSYRNKITNEKKVEDAANKTSLYISRYATSTAVFDFLLEDVRADDIIVCNDTLELEAINYKKLKNQTVYYLHGDLKHYDAALRNHQHMIDAVLCVSSGLKNKYGALYSTVPFYVSHPIVKNFDGVKKEMQLPLQATFIGRLEYLKGGDVLLETIEKAKAAALPVQWSVFVSSFGSDKNMLEALPPDVSIMLDKTNPEVLAALEQAAVLVFPSRSEGFGMVVLEAMKRGVIPVCRALPIGVPDMVIDNQTGFFAENADDFLAIFKKLLSDEALVKRMSDNAINYSREVFDENKVTEKFLANLQLISEKERGDKRFSEHKKLLKETIIPEKMYRLLRQSYSKMKGYE